jgi:hypothetical protein
MGRQKLMAENAFTLKVVFAQFADAYQDGRIVLYYWLT